MKNLTTIWRFPLRATLAVVLLGAAFQVSSLPVGAETPTPEGTPESTATATSEKALSVVGTAWIDAAPAPEGTVVQALVDGVACGEGTVVKGATEQDLALSFKLDVAAAAEKAECNKDGATISFTIGGKPAHQTLKLDAATLGTAQPRFIDLSAGEPFAAYSGRMAIEGIPVTEYLIDGDPLPQPIIIDAFVIEHIAADENWHECGEVVVGEGDLSTATPTSYAYLVVPPVSLKEGCGTEGSEIAFRIAGGVVTRTTWAPGFHQLNLMTEGPMIYAPSSPHLGPGAAERVLPAAGLAEQQETAGGIALWWAVVGVGGMVAAGAAIGLGASLVRSRRRRSGA